MRRVALLGLCLLSAVAVAGCGDGEDSSAPAAASDRTVQPAKTVGYRVRGNYDERGDRLLGGEARGLGEARGPAQRSGSPRPSGAHAGSARGVLRGDYKRLNGERDSLGRYGGRVVLVVNTATECGYTPQFEGLEALYRARRRDGLVVLGFPANDFAGQEPRSDEEIATFCEANYGVSFPMFSKTTVTGASTNPLYRALTAAAGAPEWNFNKYLVDRRGRVVARFGAGTEPDPGAHRPHRLAACGPRLTWLIPSGTERMFVSWRSASPDGCRATSESALRCAGSSSVARRSICRSVIALTSTWSQTLGTS